MAGTAYENGSIFRGIIPDITFAALENKRLLGLVLSLSLLASYFGLKSMGFPFIPFFFLFWVTLMVFIISVWRLVIGLAIFIFVIPIVNIHFALGIQDKTFSIDKILLLLLFIVWGVKKVRARDFSFSRLPVVYIWMALLGLSTLTLFFNFHQIFPQVWHILEQMAYFFFFLIALDLFCTRERIMLAAKIMLASGLIVAILAVVQSMLTRTGFESPFFYYLPSEIYRQFQMRWMHGSEVHYLYQGGSTIGHPNFFGAYQLMALPLTVAWLGFGGRLKYLLAAFLVIQVWALALSESYGSILGLMAGGVALALFSGIRKKVMVSVIAALIAAALLGGMFFFSSNKWDIRSTIETRLYALRIGTRMFLDKPLLGHGVGTFPLNFTEYERRTVLPADIPSWRGPSRRVGGREAFLPMAAHNWYLKSLVETGLLGLAATVLLLVTVLRNQRAALRRLTDPIPQTMMLAFIFGLVAFSVQALTEELFAYSKVVVIFWTIAALSVNLKKLSEAAPNPEAKEGA